MAWLQLTLETGKDHADELADLLKVYGAHSVSLSAQSDETLFSEPGANQEPLWQRTRLSAILDEDIDLDTLLVCLTHRAGNSAIVNTHINKIGERDWVQSCQEAQGPKVYANRLCVCPSWSSPPANIPHILTLDPGLAFGTGSHATTSLCLEWLASQDLRGQRLLDYGCGSGILALSALLLGADQVYAVDIDTQALTATRQNAEKNGLESRLQILHPDKLGTEEVEVNVLVANILLNPLIELAASFADLVSPGGQLLLSGLLAQQTGECLGVYRDWFNMQAPVFRDEWAMLEGRRIQTENLTGKS